MTDTGYLDENRRGRRAMLRRTWLHVSPGVWIAVVDNTTVYKLALSHDASEYAAFKVTEDTEVKLGTGKTILQAAALITEEDQP